MGEVFCRFDELTIDTPRNRLVHAALERMARLVEGPERAHQCRSLASTFARAGVEGRRPPRSEIAQNQIGRNDSTDQYMIALAELAFDLALPTEECGSKSIAAPEREEMWVHRLFERAVIGFARAELEPLGWRVHGKFPLTWQVSSASEGLPAILPRMETDFVLDAPESGHRTIIDTKFTSIVRPSRFADARLKSEYLYQMYAYLRSQEGLAPQWDHARGLFLHPAIETSVYERVVIQDHLLIFATVDLSRTVPEIRNELRCVLFGEDHGTARTRLPVESK